MRRAWIVFVLLLIGAAEAVTNELVIARAALRDGLWELARKHASAVAGDEARLIVLESWAHEGKWDEIGRCLGDWKDAKGDGFDYYRAALRDDREAAMAILRRGGSLDGLFQAQLHEARAQAKAGRAEAAAKIWRDLAVNTNAAERVRATACANLGDVALLRAACAGVKKAELRRMLGLRLGVALLARDGTFGEGERLIREIVRESPDAEGAREAFLALADAETGRGDGKGASETYHQAIETWPDLAKRGAVQEGRGWAFAKLKMWDEALEAYALAGELAKDDEARAVASIKEGDVLQESGRLTEATAKYKLVLEKYPATAAARGLKDVVKVREMETAGREHYRNFRFDEAVKAFKAVAEADPKRRDRMEFFIALCLFGQGRDGDASRRVEALVGRGEADEGVRRDARLWLAKYLYNRHDWKASGRLFAECAAGEREAAAAGEDLLWAARAASADGDFARAIQLTSRVAERTQVGTETLGRALLVQGEALIELARFDEAVLVLERVSASEAAPAADRLRARMLKADALYAMGADNPARYEAALEVYRAIRLGSGTSPGERIVLSCKIARTLEKLRRTNEAIDEYYTEVVIAYRAGCVANVRFPDEARAAFLRAAFWLADEYEGRGRPDTAVSVLQLVVASDATASAEAARRISRIRNKGRQP